MPDDPVEAPPEEESLVLAAVCENWSELFISGPIKATLIRDYVNFCLGPTFSLALSLIFQVNLDRLPLKITDNNEVKA